MFTGLVEDVGALRARTRQRDSARLTIATALPLAEIALGASVAVNGACLTVVAREERAFQVDVSLETLTRTTLGALPLGAPLHLERALRLSDRLDGHLVQGHVDGTARLVSKRAVGDGWELTFELPEPLLPQVVEKGSIALDGVSLTIASLADPRLTVALIPHTGARTALLDLLPGAAVNVETDVIGKYVQRVLGRGGAGRGGLTLATLATHGFI